MMCHVNTELFAPDALPRKIDYFWSVAIYVMQYNVLQHKPLTQVLP